MEKFPKPLVCYLENANLDSANLRNAILINADLRNVLGLYTANTTGANFLDAEIDRGMLISKELTLLMQ